MTWYSFDWLEKNLFKTEQNCCKINYRFSLNITTQQLYIILKLNTNTHPVYKTWYELWQFNKSRCAFKLQYFFQLPLTI